MRSRSCADTRCSGTPSSAAAAHRYEAGCSRSGTRLREAAAFQTYAARVVSLRRLRLRVELGVNLSEESSEESPAFQALLHVRRLLDPIRPEELHFAAVGRGLP